MKYLIAFLLLFAMCTENPTEVEEVEFVTVFIHLVQNTKYTTIYCEGEAVSLLQYKEDRDTIQVPAGSELTAEIHVNMLYLYITEIASDSLYWIIP